VIHVGALKVISKNYPKKIKNQLTRRKLTNQKTAEIKLKASAA
jgi:hypothetical protein